MKGPLLGLPSNETHAQCWSDAIQREVPADVPFHLGIALVRHDPFGADLFRAETREKSQPGAQLHHLVARGKDHSKQAELLLLVLAVQQDLTDFR
jgi:hypothetical protein